MNDNTKVAIALGIGLLVGYLIKKMPVGLFIGIVLAMLFVVNKKRN